MPTAMWRLSDWLLLSRHRPQHEIHETAHQQGSSRRAAGLARVGQAKRRYRAGQNHAHAYWVPDRTILVLAETDICNGLPNGSNASLTVRSVFWYSNRSTVLLFQA